MRDWPAPWKEPELNTHLAPAVCPGIFKTADSRFYAMEVPFTSNVMLQYQDGNTGQLVTTIFPDFIRAEAAISSYLSQGAHIV